MPRRFIGTREYGPYGTTDFDYDDNFWEDREAEAPVYIRGEIPGGLIVGTDIVIRNRYENPYEHLNELGLLKQHCIKQRQLTLEKTSPIHAAFRLNRM